jgi:type II secretory pathway component GspD/PulD (secretin)
VAEATDLIRQLDRPTDKVDSEDEERPVVRLMPLSHAEARNLAEVVSRVSRRTFSAVEVVPDTWTNTLVLAGPKKQVTEAASLIKNLDAKPSAAKARKQAKPAEAKRPKPGKGPKPKGEQPSAGAAKGQKAKPGGKDKEDKPRGKQKQQQKQQHKQKQKQKQGQGSTPSPVPTDV